ncbi:ATP-dependent zinc metalloprotease FtsH [Caldinitratiruptor microaerophilus]|nr:ATP-dependent zinc metalloprotease FtsH [Caldinitratiruptor microaerophilus]
MALAFMIGLLLLMFAGPALYAVDPGATEVSYSQFLKDVDAGRIRAAQIAGETVTAERQDGQRVQVHVLDVNYVLDRLEAQGVPVEYARPPRRPWWAGLVSGLIPTALLIAFFWLMTRQASPGGQIFQFSRSRARLYRREENNVTMKDVAGVPEAKEDLAEIIDFLKAPDRYLEMGARIPRGVLLEGPPGTGKTLLARAVAGEAGVPFFSVSGSEFVELFAGVGAARVRDLFQRARQNAPCIIFVDEIDAVGRHRGVGLGGANDEREQTLNQLLVEMDGFGPAEGIIVMAATNRIDVLDPALLRPGRFDRIIHVDPPDRRGREEILKIHARNKRLAPGVDLAQVAALTVGFTGADLANLLNEAALLTARRRKPAIGPEEIEAAFERIVTGGPEKKRVISPDEKRRVAFHEAGHAVAARKLEHSEPVQKVTIVPRGRAGGYTLFRQEEDRHLQSRREMLDFLTGILAGRAAEEVVLGDVSTGAANDLERATELARRMVTQWGMDPEVGPIHMVDPGVPVPLFGLPIDRGFSERTASHVDAAVRRLVGGAYQRAKELLQRHREGLERVAHALLERETLSGAELDQLLQGA